MPIVFLNIQVELILITFQLHFFLGKFELWVNSAYLCFLCFDLLAFYCLYHLLGSQKMTENLFIDETFIPHNILFCWSYRTLIAHIKQKGLATPVPCLKTYSVPHECSSNYH